MTDNCADHSCKTNIENKLEDYNSRINGHHTTLYGRDGMGGLVNDIKTKASVGLFWTVFSIIIICVGSSISTLIYRSASAADKIDVVILQQISEQQIRTVDRLIARWDKWEEQYRINDKEIKAQINKQDMKLEEYIKKSEKIKY